MGKQVWKPSTLLAPLSPVMVSCRGKEGEKANIITVAWCGIVNSEPPKTYISVRPERYSYNLIKESGEFVINLTTTALAAKADRLGVYSGRKIDKFKTASLTEEPATAVSCPLIGESPLCLECRVTDIIPLGSHDMFLADIVAVDVDEELIDKKGKLHLEKASLAAFAHGEYFSLGKKIGSFGFSVARKKKKPVQKRKPGRTKK